MQIKLFTVPIGDSGTALQEMNTFLKSNKILEVRDKLVRNENGAYWSFCVRFIEQTFIPTSDNKAKVDYRLLLDGPTFQKFSDLREIRKKVAADEGISAFVIFTDEELAELAKLEEITIKSMFGIKGIGEKKVERFAKYFIPKSETNETTGTLD